MSRAVLIGLLFIALAFSRPTATFAQGAQQDTAFAEALDAHTAGDYAAAVPLWRSLAKSGDPRGQFYLGNAYFKGKGIAQDRHRAYMWFVIAERDGAKSGIGSEEDLRYYRRHLTPAEIRTAIAKAQACIADNYRVCD